jgi:hypothetical protein
LPLGEDWRIDIKKGEKTGTNYILNYDLQSYVPIPAAGEAPVKALPDRRDLDVSVVWMDEGGNDITQKLKFFALGTVYQADITLTVKNGYSFDPDFHFAYSDGRVTTQPDENFDDGERVLSRVTYKAGEPPVLIDDFNLTPYLAVPFAGATPVISFSAPKYTGVVTWSPSGGIFQAGTPYRAVVTLQAVSGWTFEGVSGDFTHEWAESVNHVVADSRVVVIVVFKAAAAGGVSSAFSGLFSTEGDSAIDVIKAARDEMTTTVTLASGDEPVRFDTARDIGGTGFVLTFGSTSPAFVTIDGGGRVVDLEGTPSNHPLITVGSGVTLRLKNITFKGLTSWSGDDTANNNAPLIAVESGGHLILEDGAVIQNNFNISGEGGGVLVKGYGSFTQGERIKKGVKKG